MNNWVGKWLITVAILHMLLAFIFLGEPLRQILANGTLNSVTSAATGKAVWYLVYSLFILIVAVTIDTRRASNKTFPFFAAIIFLIFIAGNIFLLPASGFWLALPPALYLVFVTRLKSNSTQLPDQNSL